MMELETKNLQENLLAKKTERKLCFKSEYPQAVLKHYNFEFCANKPLNVGLMARKIASCGFEGVVWVNYLHFAIYSLKFKPSQKIFK